MKRLLALGITLAGLASAALADPPAESASGVELVAELERAISSQGWSGDRWSVLVMSLDAGDTLFSHNAEASLAPASNLKLFTTAAALHYLGPDYRYATYLTALGEVRGGVVEGDLLIYGTGDPTLAGRFYESKVAVLEALADSLQALGITRIEGDVVGDASYFEGPGIGEGWDTTYITHTYAAPASGLSFNENIVTLRVLPGEVGGPPEIQVIPAGSVELLNQATTTGSGSARIRVERASYSAPIVVTGSIRTGESGQWRAVPVVDPARFAASALEEVLGARGIRVGGGVRSIHRAEASPVTGRQVIAPAFDDGTPVQVLVVHRSPPLLEILKVINQRSHNLYAESVLRTVGRVATGSGTAAGGEAAVAALLEKASPAASGLRMDDGSGLSTLNRASARSIVELLAFMEQSPYWEHYWATLPEAAVSRGLRRMQQTEAAGNLRAKTGTIDGVSALSGYVTAKNGERLAFSIISNNVPSTWKAKRIEDRIGARLASFSRAIPAPRLAAEPAARDTARPGEPVADSGPTRLAESSPPDTAAAGPAESAQAAPSGTTYEIRSGDTLDGIARRHGVSLQSLREANPGLDPRRLMPGRTVTIPGD